MEKIAKDINEFIKDSYVYKNYNNYKNQVENNEELNKLVEEMKKIKNVNCKSKNEEYISRYYELEKEYKNKRIVREYENSKIELQALLSAISDILSLK